MIELIAAVALVLTGGTLWKTGVLRKIYDAIDVHGNKAADLLVSNIDLEKLDIKRLAQRVDKLGDLVDETDGLLTGAQREQNRLQTVWERKVEEMQNTDIALQGDPGRESALNDAALEVGEAQDDLTLQKEEVERIGISATNSREAWQTAVAVLRRRKSELGHAEAMAVEAKVKQIEGRILQENEELVAETGKPSEHVQAIQRELDKANAKVARLTPNPTKKKVAEFTRQQRAQAILKLYGVGTGEQRALPATPPEPLQLPVSTREGERIPVRGRTETDN